jgi:protein gp37
MADRSFIEWTDTTWNPVRGCALVSAGCTNCYAMRQAHRFSGKGQPYEKLTKMTSHGPVWTGAARTVPELLDQPLRWRKPRRIFLNSMSDLFHEDVPYEFVQDVWTTMKMAPQHTFQILTKRPERMLDLLTNRIDATVLHAHNEVPLPNVWIGISCEDQATADERIPLLLQTPAAVRFLSCEPLLGPLSLNPWLLSEHGRRQIGAAPGISWVIAGGESGPNARPSHPDWFRSLRDQCQAAGVPYFFKQWGEWEIASLANGHHDADMSRNGAKWVHNDGLVNGPSFFRDDKRDDTNPYGMIRVGKKAAGRILDGRTWDEYPR